jgi:hypothetical protein
VPNDGQIGLRVTAGNRVMAYTRVMAGEGGCNRIPGHRHWMFRVRFFRVGFALVDRISPLMRPDFATGCQKLHPHQPSVVTRRSEAPARAAD